MLEGIVDSKAKIKIVKVFVKRKEALHVSEVARQAKISKSRASECLRELSKKGVLDSKIVGRNVVYSLASSAIAKNIIEAFNQDEVLLEKISKSFINEIKKIRKNKPISIALFGSALKELRFGSDIDFFVVNGEKERFYKIASELTEKFGLRVSVLVMGYDELRKKARIGEEFVINLIANHKLFYGKKLEDLIW